MIKASNYIPEGSKILKNELIERFNSLFTRVIFIVTNQYAEENNLYYKKRYVDILLKASEDYEGSSIISGAYTE